MSNGTSLIGRIVALSTRHPAIVVLVTALLTAGAGVYAAQHFAMTANTADLMSPKLEWRQRDIELKAAFPQLVALCRDWQCKVAVVVYPWPDNVAQGDRNSIQVTHWRDWAATRGVRFIDGFAPFFRESPDAVVRKYYNRGDTHFNAAGHRLLFDEVRSATTGDY